MASTGGISEGTILDGPFRPEPVRVLTVRYLEARIEIQAAGIQSRRLYSQILNAAELAQVKVSTPSEAPPFSAAGEEFRLAVEATRIRLAHQFDPHFAVSVSQIDPLPHPLEDVYHCALKKPLNANMGEMAI